MLCGTIYTTAQGIQMTPHKICEVTTFDLHRALDAGEYGSALADAYQALAKKGWRIYVTAQSRGYCSFGPKVITIPNWVYRKSHGQLVQYIAHEFAHAIAGKAANHGVEFMRVMFSLCPAEYRHHEVGYKTRTVLAAGLVLPDDFLDG